MNKITNYLIGKIHAAYVRIMDPLGEDEAEINCLDRN